MIFINELYFNSFNSSSLKCSTLVCHTEIATMKMDGFFFFKVWCFVLCEQEPSAF